MTTVSCGAGRVSASRNSTPLALVAAEREDLLELIDDEQEPRARSVAPRLGQLVERMLSRSDHDLHPLLRAGERAGRERGGEPRTNDRGLAASRGPDDAEQRRSRQARDELRDELLAPEERVGVRDVEARQALERADSLGGRDVGVDSARACWRSTTLLVRSAWAARSSCRPAAARRAASPRRRLASARSHSATTS